MLLFDSSSSKGLWGGHWSDLFHWAEDCLNRMSHWQFFCLFFVITFWHYFNVHLQLLLFRSGLWTMKSNMWSARVYSLTFAMFAGPYSLFCLLYHRHEYMNDPIHYSDPFYYPYVHIIATASFFSDLFTSGVHGRADANWKEFSWREEQMEPFLVFHHGLFGFFSFLLVADNRLGSLFPVLFTLTELAQLFQNTWWMAKVAEPTNDKERERYQWWCRTLHVCYTYTWLVFRVGTSWVQAWVFYHYQHEMESVHAKALGISLLFFLGLNHVWFVVGWDRLYLELPGIRLLVGKGSGPQPWTHTHERFDS